MDKKYEIKEIYDTYAERISQDSEKIKNIHISVSPVMKYFRQRKVEVALQLGKFAKEDRILEVGSNTGQYTTLFAERGFSMVGIDLSSKAIEVAKKNAQMLNLKNIDYLSVDAEDLHIFEDNIFDGVVSFSTLRYVPDLRKALKEIFRVIKKNGVAILDFPNKHCPWFTLLKNKFGIEKHIYDHLYSESELKSFFRDVGFQNIETRKILFTHYTFKPNFLNLYKAIDFIGEKTLFIKEFAAVIFCKGVKI